ncbi:hypothetical protein PLICRDRAFT_46998 [Plicaturopsis crispa FD-325 SS-3]|uniref:Alpha/beta hydrolase fold-3 domain-containing protein n=1 Tax=Plicaturopsis crispa FD-325 SS-3 TaxID=944288 RepID=A0A0C9SQI8_PLICR|nr:hypothetical protein PLICRDRAFT_46998 [Plicaturopsis crispa FD-325 SS-3]
MCPLMCNGIIDNSDSLIKRVFAVDYRLTSAEPFQPANAFPAQLIDALAGYRYLLNTLGFEPANIIIGGDSAGANLTIALTRYLVASTSPALPTPGAALLVSPAGEWLLTHGDGPDSSWVRNQKSDYVEPFFRGYSARGLLGKLPPDDVYTNAWISPSSLRISKPDGIYEKFPRTCVVVGEGEIMMDAFQTLRERIVADIGEGNVTWIEEFGGTHDFVGLPFEPERTRAWKKVGEWAKTL